MPVWAGSRKRRIFISINCRTCRLAASGLSSPANAVSFNADNQQASALSAQSSRRNHRPNHPAAPRILPSTSSPSRPLITSKNGCCILHFACGRVRRRDARLTQERHRAVRAQIKMKNGPAVRRLGVSVSLFNARASMPASSKSCISRAGENVNQSQPKHLPISAGASSMPACRAIAIVSQTAQRQSPASG